MVICTINRAVHVIRGLAQLEPGNGVVDKISV